MTYYSQRDPKFANIPLGTCNTTFISNGCFCVSLSSLFDIPPLTLNKLLIDQGGYFQGCNIDAPRVAKIAGYSYAKLSPAELYKCSFPIIGETDHYAQAGARQHFFVMLDPTTIIDPLDLTPSPKKNTYNLISLRQFKLMMTPQEIKATVFALIGHNLPDDQVEYWQEQGAEKLVKFLIEHEDYQKHKEKISNSFECVENEGQANAKLKEGIKEGVNLLNNLI